MNQQNMSPEQTTVYQLIEHHYRQNRKTLVNRVRGAAGPGAEDVVQEAYANALQYWRTFDYMSDLGVDGWIRGILRNTSIAHYRNEKKAGMVDEYQAPDPLPTTNPFTRIELIELIEVIDLMKAEDPSRATILWLYLIENFETAEIDKIVPETHTNIRKIISRFRADLRKEFGR